MSEMQTFMSFTNDEWALPLKSLKVVMLEPGAVIIKEGDTPTAIYQVAKGTCVMERTNGTGSPEALAQLSYGDIFGDPGCVAHRPTNYSVKAKEKVVLYAWDSYYFNIAFVKDPVLAAKLFYYLASELKKKSITL
jgi:CRP-like cAMP-binding protein